MNQWKNRGKKLVVLALTTALIGNMTDLSVLTVSASEEADTVTVAENITSEKTDTNTNGGSSDTGVIIYEEIDMAPVETSALPILLYSLEDGVVTLKSTNEVNWIDRIDTSDAGAIKEFYNTLVEASDNDGVDDFLIEDQYLEAEEGYSIEVARVTGHESTKTNMQAAYTTAFSNYAQYIRAAYDAFDRDYPEVFWLSGDTKSSATLVYDGNDQNGYDYTLTISFPLIKEGFDIRATDYQSESAIKTAIAARDSRVNELVSAVAGKGTLEKLTYFNEQLTNTNQYNTSSSLDNIGHDCRECTSALEGRTGTVGPVCEAYARAFKVLCDKVGIPCVLVDGYAKTSSTSSGEAHMWNYVQVGGNWYGVDVTWNDPSGGSSGAVSGGENENWFLVGSETTINGMTFAYSHPVANQASLNGIGFTNGPLLKTEKCDKSELEGCSHVQEKVFYTGDGEYAPTCTSAGLGHKECTNCGVTTESDCIVDALGHEGGTATCNHKAVCSRCQQEYGNLDSSKHGETELRGQVSVTCETAGYTGDTYCKACENKISTGTVIPALGHTGGIATCTKQAVCSRCQKEYGTVDSSNHGETELRGQTFATCETAGYTGDTYCKACEEKISTGTVIPALGHIGGTATCAKKAVCDRCHKEYGNIDSSNHGETAIRGQVVATCMVNWYTGDVYCLDCGVKISTGTEIATFGHNGGTATCAKKAVCTICQQEYGTVNSNQHGETELRGAVDATCTVEGYTGDTYCKDCGIKISEGTKTPAFGHSYTSKVSKEPTVTTAGERTYTCTTCGTTKKEAIKKLSATKGTVFTDKKTKAQYKITKTGTKNGTVEYIRPTSKNTTALTIPATVTLNGITYKVTSVAKSACANFKKLTKVTIGKNVVSIGKNAFYGCKKLKTITITTTKLTTKTVGKQAFKNIYSKATITVPKSKYKSYVSLLKAKGVSKTAKFKKK